MDALSMALSRAPIYPIYTSISYLYLPTVTHTHTHVRQKIPARNSMREKANIKKRWNVSEFDIHKKHLYLLSEYELMYFEVLSNVHIICIILNKISYMWTGKRHMKHAFTLCCRIFVASASECILWNGSSLCCWTQKLFQNVYIYRCKL